MLSSCFLVFSSLLAVLIATLYLYIKHVYSHWKRRGVAYLKPSIPFGNFGPLVRKVRSIGQNIHDLYYTTSEPFIGIFLALRPALLIRDPKIAKEILIADFQHFRNRGFHLDANVDPMVQNLFSSDQKWKEMRTKQSPAFSASKLKGMFGTIVECAQPLEDCIRQHADAGDDVEVRELFSRFTTNVIALIGFGLQIDCFQAPNNEFREKASRLFKSNFRNTFRLAMSFLSPFFTRLLGIRFVDKDVSDFMVDTVRQNLEYREKNHVVRKDFFQLLMQIRNAGAVNDDNWLAESTGAEKSLSINDMAANSFGLILAGYESSSATMAFFMYEMANNPDIQQRAYEEIQEVLQRFDDELTYEALNEMKYLESCIEETLRKHPPFDWLTRVCTKEYKIADTDVTIEEGTLVMFSITAPHYDPKYYEDPQTFLPERFLADNKMANKKDSPFLTFGEGPRNCTGQRLAKLQSKLGVCLLLRKFRFELGEKLATSGFQLDPITVARSMVGGTKLKIYTR